MTQHVNEFTGEVVYKVEIICAIGDETAIQVRRYTDINDVKATLQWSKNLKSFSGYKLVEMKVTTEISFKETSSPHCDPEQFVCDIDKCIADLPPYQITHLLVEDDDDESVWGDDDWNYGPNECWQCGSRKSSPSAVCSECGAD